MTAQKLENLTGVSLLAIIVFSALTSHGVLARPQPMKDDPAYSDGEYLLLMKWLKQLNERKLEVAEKEKELAEEQMELQAMLAREANMRRDEQLMQEDLSNESPERLPVPSAIIHNQPLHTGKRTSYMALCHFKICNMGRKRQL